MSKTRRNQTPQYKKLRIFKDSRRVYSGDIKKPYPPWRSKNIQSRRVRRRTKVYRLNFLFKQRPIKKEEIKDIILKKAKLVRHKIDRQL